MHALHIIGWLILGFGILGGLYAVAAAALTNRLMETKPACLNCEPPPVTVLKPLYGAEPGLEAALDTMLAQDYPAPVQVVFGLHERGDPAFDIVERVKGRHPEADLTVVIDPARHGSNGKISNLINMMPAARHDILVLADSDIAAPPDWLTKVVAALKRPNIGAVSCLYAAQGKAGPYSTLAAMAVAYQFLPNAALGIGFGLAHPCFGSTIALTRQSLNEIGGFSAYADLLADDYEIGRAVRARGKLIAYPPLTVTHCGDETNFGEVFVHELRWARTVRTIDPKGHWGSFITHAFPLGLMGAALAGFTPTAIAALATILGGRLFLKTRIDHIVGASAGPAWALPLRDLLSFVVFLASLTGTAVRWRGARLRVRRDGAMS